VLQAIAFGLINDVLQWLLIAPFFTGMLYTSLLSLKHVLTSMAPVLCWLSALLALTVDRFFPDLLKVDRWMMLRRQRHSRLGLAET